MKKLVFELGLLAFCVSVVVFVLQGFDIFDTLGRSFIVFVAVELIGGLILAATATRPAHIPPHDGTVSPSAEAPRETPAGTYQQPSAQPKGGAV
ncbi:MAG: hypothetical protein MUF82_07910 [Bacteroidetes bacterium]|nr:hypothetical protein [Bacteroidota bacterium]